MAKHCSAGPLESYAVVDKFKKKKKIKTKNLDSTLSIGSFTCTIGSPEGESGELKHA